MLFGRRALEDPDTGHSLELPKKQRQVVMLEGPHRADIRKLVIRGLGVQDGVW